MWLAIESGFNPLVPNLINLGAGLFCLLVMLKGIPLLRFFSHSLTLYVDGIEITRGPLSKFYAWEQVGSVVGSDTFQILRIYDQGGRLVYAVDYYAKNYTEFAELFNELFAAQP